MGKKLTPKQQRDRDSWLEAKALTPYGRRVLHEIWTASCTVTIGHIVTLLGISNRRHNVTDFRTPVWPVRQLIGLERLGLVEAHFVDAGEFSTRLYRITDDGKSVNQWTYSDGSICDAPHHTRDAGREGARGQDE
jgi:hypothetical protein